jgi:hypothetical protein
MGFKHSLPNRSKGDFYQTPPTMTEHLLKRVQFDDTIIEPACGDGAIVNVLKRSGYQVHATDLSTGDDFTVNYRYFKNMVTNPPFSLAKEFILQGIRFCERTTALLLPLDYLHGKERFNMFFSAQTTFPLRQVFVFVRRPLLTPERPVEPYATGSLTYAWFIWRRLNHLEFPRPEIRWINNSMDVRGSTPRVEDEDQGGLFDE